MTHKTTKRFQDLLHDLPPQIQSTAKEKFKLLKENPGHPSLHFKKVGKFWSVRINDNYRALAVRGKYPDMDMDWEPRGIREAHQPITLPAMNHLLVSF